MLKPFIAKAINRTDLTAEEAQEAMNIIMTGQATPAQIGAYLIALRMKGETIPEITGSVRAMRANAVKVQLMHTDEPVYDIVGTGGDGAHTFNISTAAAFILAGMGRKVAKHGNRAASSQCGSADVLSALGVNLDLTPEQVARAIEEIGIGFMFAPKFHPAMRHAIGPDQLMIALVLRKFRRIDRSTVISSRLSVSGSTLRRAGKVCLYLHPHRRRIIRSDRTRDDHVSKCQRRSYAYVFVG